MTWIDKFRHEYMPLLDRNISGAKRGLYEGIGNRGKSFQLMFELLLSKRAREFHIVETGTCRRPGNWKDGQSTQLFCEFADHYGGSVRSVDIDPEACTAARSHLANYDFRIHCGDSVEYLASLDPDPTVDLFYLDSWDVKWADDTASAQHHLREFRAIEPKLVPGTIVAIDDNARRLVDNTRTGKGRLIVEYLAAQGIEPIYDQYQIIYLFR